MHADFQTSGFSDALVILGAAGVVIPAFARFRISPVIGFILVGLLVGPAGPGSMAAETPWLHYLTISTPDPARAPAAPPRACWSGPRASAAWPRRRPGSTTSPSPTRTRWSPSPSSAS